MTFMLLYPIKYVFLFVICLPNGRIAGMCEHSHTTKITTRVNMACKDILIVLGSSELLDDILGILHHLLNFFCLWSTTQLQFGVVL